MQRRALHAVTLTLLAISACSGGSSGDPIPSEVTADGVATAGEPAPTDEDTDTTARADSADSAADFCAAISAIQAAEFELEETFGLEARALFDDVRATAPDDIADDVDTVIATLDSIAEIGISADENDPAAVDAAFEILFDPSYTEANENLAVYTSQTCGIDLTEGSDDADLADLDELDG